MTNKPLVVLLEIGQSPCLETQAEFRHVLGDSCDIKSVGALDHLNKNEIAQHLPENGSGTLFVTLSGGQSMLISKRLVIDGLLHCMVEIREINALVNILCCSGAFSEIELSGVLTAYDLISNAVRDKVAKGSKLGVFVPDEEQVAETIKDWSNKGYQVEVVPLAPDAEDNIIEAAANRMRDLMPDTVVYDCMGYTHELQFKAETIHSINGILAIGAAAQHAARLLGIIETTSN